MTSGTPKYVFASSHRLDQISIYCGFELSTKVVLHMLKKSHQNRKDFVMIRIDFKLPIPSIVILLFQFCVSLIFLFFRQLQCDCALNCCCYRHGYLRTNTIGVRRLVTCSYMEDMFFASLKSLTTGSMFNYLMLQN